MALEKTLALGALPKTPNTVEGPATLCRYEGTGRPHDTGMDISGLNGRTAGYDVGEGRAFGQTLMQLEGATITENPRRIGIPERKRCVNIPLRYTDKGWNRNRRGDGSDRTGRTASRRLHRADAREIPLPEMPRCICVVTSPPYWGLRDYGLGEWEGGDAECGHKVNRIQETRVGWIEAASPLLTRQCGSHDFGPTAPAASVGR